MAELAYHLALWLRSPAAGREDFALDSMRAEPGTIRIVHSGEGWRIGSGLTPDFSGERLGGIPVEDRILLHVRAGSAWGDMQRLSGAKR
ncbi:hypothetical protein [Streptomyces sp. DH24]|uniref:hypothetical protein n=1 Tax=Streptomyces sp. DH24 TaxID=3040123 RepID=UPI002443480A|nr:hypothetical protein [Streptomyces sp. DH24]MDG9720046.1 hypothetical protein [Streptomyces sp. DH24]